MNQRKLYRTIENLTPENYRSKEELFTKILQEIIRDDKININGARIWKLDTVDQTYKLIHQMGDIERLEDNFQLNVSEYPLFHDIADHRSVKGVETHDRLRAVGIKHYAATGVGEKISLNGFLLYPYILAFNSDKLDEDLLDTLNIISAVVTSYLKSRRMQKESEAMQLELTRAREIQTSILPQHEYSFSNYEIYGTTIPEAQVCGDFFDYIEIGGDTRQLGVVVGDAAGKGISAAVQALYISGALRLGASHQIKTSAFISTINKMITRTFPDERFATLFYAELFDNQSGLCLYVNAGHNSPIFYNGRRNETRYLETTGGMLGLTPEQHYIAENINIRKGDMLVLYSDGITEARNTRGDFFGEERLEEIIKKEHDKSAREIVQSVVDKVIRFSANGKYNDDKTLVVIKRIQ
jgi:phosphoserine phosphatase RsbU/P